MPKTPSTGPWSAANPAVMVFENTTISSLGVCMLTAAAITSLRQFFAWE